MVTLSLTLIAYSILHSMLASLWLKQRVARSFPQIVPWYRLFFNIISIVLLLPILWLLEQSPGDYLWQWQWQGALRGVMYAAAGLAFFGFIHSLKFYDMSEFMGFKQIKEQAKQVEEQQRLTISPYHRFVRHPWYFFAIVLIWARDINVAIFIFNSLITGYFVLGSKLEERKLLKFYGRSYQIYQQKVPAIFPLPWRYLNAKQALQLERQSGSN